MGSDEFQPRKWARLGQNSAFGSIALTEAAKKKQNIRVVLADNGSSIAIGRLKKQHPEYCYNIGIAEQNLTGVAAGLSLEGNCVFAVANASFLTMRSFEFVRHLLSYMKCNVKIVGTMAGTIFGSAGISHWSVEDLSLMRSIPNLLVLSPADVGEMYKMVQAVAELPQPAYIRLTGGDNCPIVYQEDYDFEIGKAITLREGTDAAIVATGLPVKDSLDAAEILQERGISCTVVDMHTIKPLDGALLEQLYQRHRLIVTVEEHNIVGGLGGAVAEHKAGFANTPRQLFLGITDEFKKTGTRDFILEQYGLTPEGIAESIQMNL